MGRRAFLLHVVCVRVREREREHACKRSNNAADTQPVGQTESQRTMVMQHDEITAQQRLHPQEALHKRKLASFCPPLALFALEGKTGSAPILARGNKGRNERKEDQKKKRGK